MADLKGRRIAHTSPSSNSGNLAPRALFPSLGITPDKDYKVLFSGGHDRSVLGVRSGDFDAAPVASDVYERMADRGVIKESEFRVIWQSNPFPTSSFAYAHDLEPKFRDQMLKCFYDFRFPEPMQKAFDGADRFVPVTYAKEWADVRKVAEASGESFGSQAFDALAKREEAARQKAAAAKAAPK
jgi:phosphonate transport system substrate-binding protein